MRLWPLFIFLLSLALVFASLSFGAEEDDATESMDNECAGYSAKYYDFIGGGTENLFIGQAKQRRPLLNTRRQEEGLQANWHTFDYCGA